MSSFAGSNPNINSYCKRRIRIIGMKIQTLEERGGAKWKDFDRGGDAELLFFLCP